MTTFREEAEKILNKVMADPSSFSTPLERSNAMRELMSFDEAVEALTALHEREVRQSHKSGYIAGVNNFSGYFMDASIPAQRQLIMPDIARSLIEEYESTPYFIKYEPVERRCANGEGEE